MVRYARIRDRLCAMVVRAAEYKFEFKKEKKDREQHHSSARGLAGS
jgi:hypothetical protein